MLWLNGALVAAAEARIEPSDRGFLLGDGVFETLRVSQGAPEHLARHLRRLRHGAATLGIALDHDDAALARAAAAVLAARRLEHAVLRITLTRGPGGRGVLPAETARPTLLLAAHPLPAAAPTVTLTLATCTRRNAFSPLSRIKSLAYGDAILARQEAARAGMDDAVLLDTRGRVAEASAANLFVLLDGALLTPPVEDGALPGIGRALAIARLGAREQTLAPDDLRRAAALLLTSSLGVRAATALDGAAVPRLPDLEAAMRAALADGPAQGAA